MRSINALPILVMLYGISGNKITSPPPAMPEYKAIQPDLCPITSITITRLCELAVECNRSMASVATLTAESNPKVVSVPHTSLSIVLGIETTLIPNPIILAAVSIVPLPPIHTTQSSLNSCTFFLMRVGLSASGIIPPRLKGCSRDEPRMVPF